MNIKSMHGLGDNIYQRAVFRSVSAPIYLDTPWPQLYEDLLHIHFVRPQTKLRTQAKNVELIKGVKFHGYPMADPILHMRYTGGRILEDMGKCVGLKAVKMDLPQFPRSPYFAAPYVIVRPPTLRKEWHSASRNPLPEYIDKAARAARAAGYLVVSIADIQAGQEWIVGDAPYADVRFHGGELNIERLLPIIQNAAGVIGGVGWVVPACLAYQTKAFIIFGGWGHFNSPENVLPPYDTPWVTCALPDKFCRCRSDKHDCDKHISNIDTRIAAWISSLTP